MQSEILLVSVHYNGFYDNDIIPTNWDASTYRGRWWDLHGIFVLHNDDNYVHWILRTCSDCHETSCVFQTKGPSLLSCLGILFANMSDKNPSDLCGSFHLGDHDLLCYRLWSEHWKVKRKTWQTLHVSLGSKSFVMKLIKFCNSRFFKQFILLLCLSQMANGLFRLLAVVGRSPVVANTFGSAALLVLFVLGGFVLSRGESFIQLYNHHFFSVTWFEFWW